jgi:hypothetical protein
MKHLFVLALAVGLSLPGLVRADAPVASYIFPAGGQRGTTVNVRVGGLFLHKSCSFEMLGPGITAPQRLLPMPTLWFEGPLLPLPDSQRQEDYPKDMAGQIKIAPDAPLGLRYWQLATSQGATPALKFLVGDLPEIIEQEIEGDAVPVDVKLPVTVNGRIFPRADVDLWALTAKRGQTVTCEVHAARLGSPLEARLEVLDEQGKPLTASETQVNGDPRLRFTAPHDGKYQVRIQDANFLGSQAHVYRLTLTADPYVDRVFPLGGKRGTKVEFEAAGQGIPARAALALPEDKAPWTYGRLAGSNAFLLDLDDVEEFSEPGQEVPVPAVCNGRIAAPGEIDAWKVSLGKGEALQAELRAARLGSPLDGILSVVDAFGKELARAETPLADLGDPLLRFTAPADGAYVVRVQDRFRSRGGPAYAYRLRLSRSAEPDFRLRIPSAVVNVPRGGKAQIQVAVERQGNFAEPVTLTVDGLPKGVTVKWNDKTKGAGAVTVQFEADKEATVGPARLVIRGTATRGSETISRVAALPAPLGQPALESLLLAVALPAPFKVKGEYDMRWAARGSVHSRKYQVERNGYGGPLEISLADRQARHLQGVHAAPIIVPAGATEFTFEVHLPPWMETGRTSRTCVMAVGVIKDKDGTEHEVSFSSVNQNEQLIAVVEPGKLGLNLDRTSLAVAPGKTLSLPFQVSRGPGLQGPVTVELIVPAHMKGVRSEKVSLGKDSKSGSLTIRCDEVVSGPFNMPLVVRATLDDNGRAVLAESRVEFILQP